MWCSAQINVDISGRLRQSRVIEKVCRTAHFYERWVGELPDRKIRTLIGKEPVNNAVLW